MTLAAQRTSRKRARLVLCLLHTFGRAQLRGRPSRIALEPLRSSRTRRADLVQSLRSLQRSCYQYVIPRLLEQSDIPELDYTLDGSAALQCGEEVDHACYSRTDGELRVARVPNVEG